MTGCLPMLMQIPIFYVAVQGAVGDHRDAARAVLRLDPRPVGREPTTMLEPVRPDPLGSGRPCRCSAASGLAAPGPCWPLLYGFTMWLTDGR